MIKKLLLTLSFIALATIAFSGTTFAAQEGETIVISEELSNLNKLYIEGFSAHQASSGSIIYLLDGTMQVGETYVWNDKFSFNGYEPTGTDVFSTAAHQTANAAQAGSTAQYLKFGCDHANDNYDITVTYLDQDWS